MSGGPKWHDDFNLPRRLEDIKALQAKLETALRLLGESECPHTEDDYKSVRRNGGWFCCAGFKAKHIGGRKMEVSDKPCPHCEQVKEVLGDE